jgi:flagellar biosynthesis GTPase FlhF
VQEPAPLLQSYSRIKGNYTDQQQVKELAVTSASTSYLQSLPDDEAASFLAALQKVKDHLGKELQLLNEQVQQKTIQLQGIEALLAETQAQESVKQKPSSTPSSSTPSIDLLDPITPLPSVNEPPLPATNGATAADGATTAPQKQSKPAQSPAAAKAKSPAKATTASKGNTAPKKKTTAQPKAKGKKPTTAKSSELRQLLRPPFQDKSFGDAVSEILAQANQPLHLDDLVDQLYGELSNSDYERAKVSLSKVLSVGSSKGRWKNVSRGMYAGAG